MTGVRNRCGGDEVLAGGPVVPANVINITAVMAGASTAEASHHHLSGTAKPASR